MGTAYAPTTAKPRVATRFPAVAVGHVFTAAFSLVAAVGAFLSLHRLGAPVWGNDELIYRDAGRAYLRGDFSPNPEHPPLVKYILGVTQLVGGSGPGAVRLPGAIAGILTGFVLFLIARRLAGRWAGLSVFASWSLLPHPFGAMRVERLAMLEPFMMLGVVVAIWAGERWATTGEWRWASATGVAVGLAMASKIPGILALVVVAAIGLTATGGMRRLWPQFLAITALALAVFVLSYAPFGSAALPSIQEMWAYQQRHSVNGHPIVIAGTSYAYPPWWSAAWLFWSKGPGTAVAYGGLALLAPFALPRRTAVITLSFLVSWAIFLIVLSPILLRHYLYALSPAIALICGLVIWRLFTSARAGRLTALVASLLLLGGALTTANGVVNIKASVSATPESYAAAAAIIDRANLEAAPVFVFGPRSLAAAYLPAATFVPERRAVDPIDNVIIVDEAFMKASHRGWELTTLRRKLGQDGTRRTHVQRSVPGGVVVFLPRRRGTALPRARAIRQP
ncbi:MAG: glycosyltransferase family 39 protein [Actinobacteria bacterium]|nr:glycosyltransferase family 39 protein [Actinomycetota bacterium]